MDEVLRLVKERGAITVKDVREGLRVESVEACQRIASLLEEGSLVWIPALPGQAVFFSVPENSKKFGIPLRRGVSGSSKKREAGKARKEVEAKILLDLEMEGAATTEELVSRLEMGRDAIKRYLQRLEAERLVICHKVRTGKRGRPTLVWGVTEEDIATVAEWLIRIKSEQHERSEEEGVVIVDFRKQS